MKRLALLISAFMFCVPAFAGGATDHDTPDEKFAPNQVEVHLRDGSMLLGEISGVDALSLKTPYGTLNFPLNHVLRVRAGFRLAKQDETDILALIKDLDSDEFNVRGQAQKRLEERGAAAASVLRDVKGKVSAEARSRIDAILKRIGDNNPKLVLDDSIKSDEFEATGTLQFETVTVKSHIGDVKVKLEDLDSIRFLANGSDKSLTLDASTGMDDWFDTGVDSTPGEKISVTCTGTVNLFGNLQTGPEGTTNWGNRPFLTGAVVGKLGDTGKPFLIGATKQWATPNKLRLYVKIFCAENTANNNTNQSTGEFKVRVATGVWSDETATSGDATGTPNHQARLRARR